jgi:hypothetical protein
MARKIRLLVALLLAIPFGVAGGFVFGQGGLWIGSGAFVVASGSPSIVVSDGRFQNDGAFTSASSLVRMEGTASTANSTITGTSPTTFHDFTQQKSANGILLAQNIVVNNNFTMNGGLFELNNFFVTLGSATGQIVSESELNRVTGLTGGEIIKTMPLNAPTGVNPGNLGAVITSSANLGSTTIRRGHVQQTDGNAGLSINRYYDILPTNNTGLSATLRQQYFDAELAGRVEAELQHYNSLDGGLSWFDRSFSSRNTASNFVEQVGYADLSTRWTLASPINQPLPVVWVGEGLRCTREAAELFWTVVETAGSDHFEVEQSADQVAWQRLADGYIASRGTGRNRYVYPIVEAANFFRVVQVDAAGATSVSEAHRLTCNIAGSWHLWPNPAVEAIQVKAPFGQAMKGYEISNMLGQVLLQASVAETTQHTILLEGKLPAGMYALKVFPVSGDPAVKKFEVGR